MALWQFTWLAWRREIGQSPHQIRCLSDIDGKETRRQLEPSSVPIKGVPFAIVQRLPGRRRGSWEGGDRQDGVNDVHGPTSQYLDLPIDDHHFRVMTLDPLDRPLQAGVDVARFVTDGDEGDAG